MATYTAPATFDDLVSEYDHYIGVVIQRVSRGNVRSAGDLHDLKQAVYSRLLETSYLQKYVPAKGSFSNYLFVLVRSVVINVFEKNGRTPTNSSLGIVEANAVVGSRGREYSPTVAGCISVDRVPGCTDSDFERRQAAADVVDRLEAAAKQSADGAQLLQVLWLLYDGLTPGEIAEQVSCPVSRVSRYRKQLRKILTHRLHEAAA